MPTLQQYLFHPNREALADAPAATAESVESSPAPPRRPLPEGERRKRVGMRQAADAARDRLHHARDEAVRLATASPFGCVTADDVAAALAASGRAGLGNAAGSLFRGGQWEWTGLVAKSARPEAHANLLKVWRLVDYAARTGRPPQSLPEARLGIVAWPPNVKGGRT